MDLIVGMDVSKSSFDSLVLLGDKGKHRQCLNAKEGFAQFWSTMQKLNFDKLYVCMEATGLYWEALAEYLHEQGATVFVVNARRIKGFAMSEHKRTKTDKVDAGVIARFCRAHLAELNAWAPPAPEVRKLLSLTRQLDSLKEDRARQVIRIQSALLCTEAADSIKLHIEFLDDSIETMERAIEALIKSNPVLRQQRQLAISIKGVGAVTAAVVLAECRLFKDFVDRRQVAAFAGLDVSEFLSGSSINCKPRLSKRGNPRIRKALYMAALSAKRYNPVLKSLYDRLVLNGKTKMQAIGACMRKLLELIFAVVKSGKSFDPAYVTKRARLKESVPA
jgi:transposase